MTCPGRTSALPHTIRGVEQRTAKARALCIGLQSWAAGRHATAPMDDPFADSAGLMEGSNDSDRELPAVWTRPLALSRMAG